MHHIEQGVFELWVFSTIILLFVTEEILIFE